MGCTVSELGERITAEEFSEACVYLREEPLDPALLAALAEMLAALANGPLSRRDKQLWTAADFMLPRWQAADPQATPEHAATAPSAPTQAQINALFSHLHRPGATSND